MDLDWTGVGLGNFCFARACCSRESRPSEAKVGSLAVVPFPVASVGTSTSFSLRFIFLGAGNGEEEFGKQIYRIILRTLI